MEAIPYSFPHLQDFILCVKMLKLSSVSKINDIDV